MQRINAAGLALIKKYEGLRLEAYQCEAGVWTIGYGHTGDVEPHHRITEHQAEAILGLDVAHFEDGVFAHLEGRSVNENQFAALVSLAFNIGLEALRKSTLLRYIKQGQEYLAADEFGKWIHAGGKPSNGLIKRRADERALFRRPVSPARVA
jgi:lysozyme